MSAAIYYAESGNPILATFCKAHGYDYAETWAHVSGPKGHQGWQQWAARQASDYVFEMGVEPLRNWPHYVAWVVARERKGALPC